MKIWIFGRFCWNFWYCFVIFDFCFKFLNDFLIFGFLDFCFKFPVFKIFRIKKEALTFFEKMFYRGNQKNIRNAFWRFQMLRHQFGSIFRTQGSPKCEKNAVCLFLQRFVRRILLSPLLLGGTDLCSLLTHLVKFST